MTIDMDKEWLHSVTAKILFISKIKDNNMTKQSACQVSGKS